MPFDGIDQRKPLTSAEKLQLERLQAGRERIRYPHLWTQYSGPNGSTRPLMGRCVIEAVNFSCDRLYVDCLKLLVAQLPPHAERSGFYVADVTRFNDDPNTTHAGVLGLFDRTIAALVERQ